MIDGFTARSYLDGLESATGVDRHRMERELLEYADAEEEKEADHYKKLMTDDGYRDSLLKGNPVIEDAQKTAPQPNETPFEAANRGYLGWVEGRDSLGRDYFALRDAYANTHFGKYTVGDKEFYDLIRGSYETEDKQIAARNDLNQTTVREALEDSLTGNRVSLVDTVAKWKEKYPELVDEEKDLEYLASAMQLRAQTRRDLEGIAPHAAKIWDVLKRYQDGTAFTEGKADEADIQALGMELTRLTDPQIEQAKRYAVMAAQAQGDTDLSSLEQFATNLAQSTSRSFGWAESPLRFKQIGGALPLSIPTIAYTPLDILELNTALQREKVEKSSMPEPAKVAELERLDQADRMAHIVRGLYDTAKNGIDPIKPVLPKGTIGGTIERIAYTNAASIGYMAAAGINPMLGTYAYARDEYETMRRQNPEMPAVLAAEVSVVSGGLQSFMDRWQISLFTKRLPLTGKFLTDFKRGVVTTAANIGVAYGMESAIEHLQDATSTGIQLLVSNLRADAPDQNVEKVMKDYWDQRVDVQLAMLPLGFLAGGVATIRDFKQAGLADAELTRFGFGRAAKDRIHRAADQDKEAVIRAEAPLRKQADIEKGIALVEKDIKAAEKLQADPEMPTLEKVTLPDGTPEWHVRRNEGTVAPAEKRTVLTEADLAGKSVEITYVSPTDGSMQSVVKDATEAHAEVMKKEDAYSKLIDCLTR